MNDDLHNIVNTKIGPCFYVEGFGKPTTEGHKMGGISVDNSLERFERITEIISELPQPPSTEEGDKLYFVSYAKIEVKPMLTNRAQWSSKVFQKHVKLWLRFRAHKLSQGNGLTIQNLDDLQYKSPNNQAVISVVASVLGTNKNSIALASVIPMEQVSKFVANYLKSNAVDLTAERVIKWG